MCPAQHKPTVQKAANFQVWLTPKLTNYTWSRALQSTKCSKQGGPSLLFEFQMAWVTGGIVLERADPAPCVNSAKSPQSSRRWVKGMALYLQDWALTNLRVVPQPVRCETALKASGHWYSLETRKSCWFGIYQKSHRLIESLGLEKTSRVIQSNYPPTPSIAH